MGNIVLPNYMDAVDLEEDASTTSVKLEELSSGGAQSGSFASNFIAAIEGIPYQFLPSVDRRVTKKSEEEGLGRKYSQKILTQMPLLFLMPCKPKFLPAGNKEQRNVIEKLLITAAEGAKLDVILNQGMYYTSEFDKDTYYKYLSYMLGSIAYYLGIENEEITLCGVTGKLYNFNWGKINAGKGTVDEFFGANNSVCFYVDGLSSQDISFSNDTTTSGLADKINGYGDQFRELSFLLGGGGKGADKLAGFAGTLAEGLGGAVNEILEMAGLTSGEETGMLAALSDEDTVANILRGGRIGFPEIWADSSADQSYSFSIKLRSPDNDTLSIFLNVIKPYCELLALTLPHGIENDPNSFKSPFLVKGFCKGLFHIDIGIIDGLSVTRGAECMWNDDGLPTQMDIQVNLKNLYSNLCMGADVTGGIQANTEFTNFLMNTAGCNVMEQIYAGETLNYALFNLKHNLLTIPSKLYNKFENDITNAIGNFYNGLR